MAGQFNKNIETYIKHSKIGDYLYEKLWDNICIYGSIMMVLAGLEKILISLSYNGNGNGIDMTAIKNLTPSYLWNITNFTFWFGLLFFIIGLSVFFEVSKYIKVEN